MTGNLHKTSSHGTISPLMKSGLLAILCVLIASFVLLSLATKKPSSLPYRLTVVTTVAPITNIAQNIAGDKLRVVGLIPDGTDSHTYEPTPENAKTLSEADLIFVNGLGLEEPTAKLALRNKKSTIAIISLGENTVKQEDYIYDFSFPKEGGIPNPHLWMNPLYGARYADVMREHFAKLDPTNTNYYKMRYELFKDRIVTLDAAISQAINSIPPNNRKLLTYHDSFAYFASRYGMMVIGAIQPADFKEPKSTEVAALINQLKKERVPAIFGSEVFESRVVETIGKEAGITFIGTLSDDVLPGDTTSVNHSYIGLLVENVRTMTQALGGDPSTLSKVDVADIK